MNLGASRPWDFDHCLLTRQETTKGRDAANAEVTKKTPTNSAATESR